MSESLVDRLTAQRDRLTELLNTTDDPSKAAAASRELRALEVEIEKAGGGKAGSDLDDLAARRAARISEAAGVDKAPVRKRGRGAGSD